MKTRASLKKRTPDCKIVRRKGRLLLSTRRTLSSKCVRVKTHSEDRTFVTRDEDSLELKNKQIN